MDESRTERAWGVELWDQSDNLLAFTSEQNTVSQNYMNLLSDLQKMHHDIAKKYKKVVSPYMPKKKADSDLSYQATFFSLAQSYYDMANFHEELANNLAEQIVTAFKTLTEQQKDFVTMQTKKRQQLVTSLDDKKKILEKSWATYLRAHKDKVIARDQNAKAQKDEFLPRVDMKKYEEIFNNKTQDCNQASMRYANDLRNFNDFSTKFYTMKNMDFITEIEELDVVRSEKTKLILEKASDLHINSFKRLLEACESNKSLAGLLDHRKDRVTILNKLRTEYYYPPEAQFLDLDVCPPTLLEGPVSRLTFWLLGEPKKNPSEDSSKSSGFNLFGRSKAKKEEAVSLITPFFGGLGVKPQKLNDLTIKQVDRRIVALTARHEHLSKELTASSTMESIYSTDPSFGDANSVEKRVAGYNRQLRSLELVRDNFEKRYDELGGDEAKIECLRRIDQYCPSNGSNCDSAYRSESGIYDTIPSSAEYDKEFSSDEDTRDENHNAASNEASAAFVGKGTALYDYAGNGDRYLPASAGDVFEIIAFDSDNSGWTAVMDKTGKEGFVPTNFIDITKY